MIRATLALLLAGHFGFLLNAAGFYYGLSTLAIFFFLKKSQMSPSFVWGLLLLLFVAPIQNHIESDCAQYCTYSQKRGRAVTVQKSPQSLIGAAHLLCAKGVWSLVFWHAVRIWHVRLPVLGLARYTLSLQGGLLPHGPKTTPAAGILFWVFLVSENMSEINLILYKWLPLVFCNSHKN